MKTILKKSFSKKWKFMNKDIESLENMEKNLIIMILKKMLN